jgi:hypothetical protein
MCAGNGDSEFGPGGKNDGQSWICICEPQALSR